MVLTVTMLLQTRRDAIAKLGNVKSTAEPHIPALVALVDVLKRNEEENVRQKSEGSVTKAPESNVIEAKRRLDASIDACDHMQHLLKCIFAMREKVTKQLAGFTSMWRTLCSWRCASARASCERGVQGARAGRCSPPPLAR